MTASEPEPGFTFIDRRRRGEEHPPGEPAPSRPAPAARRPEPVAPRTTASTAPAGGPQADLGLLCHMLGSNAMACLGQIPDATGSRSSVDLGQARLLIDLLEVLRDKTRGNRSEEETAILDEMVAGLRMAFVQVSRRA